MTIKKKIQPKYRLPVLNWVAMKPNQVKGTVFSEIDDEKLYKVSMCITLSKKQAVDHIEIVKSSCLRYIETMSKSGFFNLNV